MGEGECEGIQIKPEFMYGIDWETWIRGAHQFHLPLADDDASLASGSSDGELAELLLAGWLAG